MLDKIQRIITKTSVLTGIFASWFTSALVVIMCVDVFMRYFLKISHVWVIELEAHMFALVFLIGAAYTLNKDAHVRVDLFYAKFSEVKKAWVNLVGVFLFLIPWCLVVIRAASRYAHNSYKIRETSPDPGGLPALWIVKYMVVVAFILLILEAVGLGIRSLLVILGKRSTVFPEATDD
ncbi:MAG: TRAP transporter small permease subunit [Saprospiraceae bacterium]|nr:TRAP transporter small permease subunit [Saprospiraceae bacterium]